MPTGLARIIHERRRKTPVSLMTQCNLAIRKFNKVLDAFSCWHGPRGSFVPSAALLVAPMEPPLRLRAPCAWGKILRDHPRPFMNNAG